MDIQSPMQREKTGENTTDVSLSRRSFLTTTGAAIAAAVAVPIVAAQEQSQVPRSPDHHFPNEQQPGPNNTVEDKLEPDSVWSLPTDNGTVPPFKYSFDLAHKEIDSGGWFTLAQLDRWTAARPQDFATGFLECWRVFRAASASPSESRIDL